MSLRNNILGMPVGGFGIEVSIASSLLNPLSVVTNALRIIDLPARSKNLNLVVENDPAVPTALLGGLSRF